MIGIFLYSTFPFLRLEFIATIKSPSILAVESSLGRNPVKSEIASAIRKLGSVKVERRKTNATDYVICK